MKLKITLALFFFILVSIVLHAYLTSHYYPLRFGLGAAESMCNVGETFNCDAVAASSYSSFLDVPLSVWGLATNIVLLIMVLVFWLGLTDRVSDWKRWTLWVSALSALASVVMGVISLTQLTTYCLFCIILYFLSFAVLICLSLVQDEKVWPQLPKDFLGLFTVNKGFLISLVAIPVIAFLSHASIMRNYQANELDAALRSFIYEWTTSPEIAMTAKPAFSFGVAEAEAKLVVAEYADFRCGHCKDAAPSLHAFAKAHPKEVHFKFYTFPLDGECNSEIPNGDGVSCRLAKSVICADQQGQALKLHDEIFKHQTDLNRLRGVDKIDEELKQMSAKLSISFDQLSECMSSAATQDMVNSHVQQAKMGGLRGTPTIFANSRKLERGQLIPVLEAALKHAASSK